VRYFKVLQSSIQTRNIYKAGDQTVGIQALSALALSEFIDSKQLNEKALINHDILTGHISLTTPIDKHQQYEL
jgi:hypothetical protein